ncbi:hypothetical protein GIX81_02850 [Lactobacillus reuteri]|uniref:Uncharacterized protein n=1 Tax=Limosilactobacillus reuteri TaxID=1598 RepID=A0A6L5P2E3_LIMRT|nr:hypothetical protein [Limosilactobacillus reuteri]MRH08396.1 hypothetical protein [Limosilactobacillus reuteri]
MNANQRMEKMINALQQHEFDVQMVQAFDTKTGSQIQYMKGAGINIASLIANLYREHSELKDMVENLLELDEHLSHLPIEKPDDLRILAEVMKLSEQDEED